jgi:hypothetical protein
MLEVWEHAPSTLRNVDGGPPEGARARGPRAPTINAKKRQWQIRERPPSTLRNVDGGPREVP